jgi:hypothetical protein
VTDALVSARQRPPQFPLRSYTPRQFPLRPYTVGIRRFIDTQQYKEALRTFVLIWKNIGARQRPVRYA